MFASRTSTIGVFPNVRESVKFKVLISKQGQDNEGIMRVLVIEDEERLANFIRKGLTESGYAVDVSRDAEEGDFQASVNDYDLILLDWILPEMSGLELAQKWRNEGVATPIIMLTAKDDQEDIIAGLDGGADDYLVKPFSFSELLARMRAILRRASALPPSTKLKFDDLAVDVARHEVKRAHHKVLVSAREFALLEFLMRNVNKVVTKTEISEHVWGNLFETNTNIIEVTINHLRNKLDCGSRRPLIQTVRGVGYTIQTVDGKK